MEKIKGFQITGMTITGFKCYKAPTEIAFGNPTIVTGGNGRGKSSLADAIAFTVTGLPFSGSAALTGCTTRRTRTCRSRCALRMIPERRMS